MSWQAHLYSALLRLTFKRRLVAAADAQAARAVLNSGPPFRVPRDVNIRQAVVGGVAGEWVESGHAKAGPVLLYLHGGGYFACSPRSHRPITTFFAQHGFRVFVPDYRLAPEHPFPAAVEDAEAVYVALLASGIAPGQIAVAGDSAGGGLTLALLLKLRQRRLRQPAAAALFSPLTDLAGTGQSMHANDARCAMFRGRRIAEAGQYYLNGVDPREPLASPLYAPLADLAGLPPLLIHVGSDEVLRDDSIRMTDRTLLAGVRTELKVWPVVPHCWQLFRHHIPEGRASLEEAAAFLQRAMLPVPTEARTDAATTG